ncbi:MAG: xanthine dehydrogenase accessory protein XdhC [Pseudomonadota bacterium]
MTLDAFLATGGPVAAIEVTRVQGSAPREVGAWMLVSPQATHATIGGGALEHRAIARARALLAEGDEALDLALPLGPAIGQCCGGQVTLAIRRLDARGIAEHRARLAAQRASDPPVAVFGAGHVGLALARALALLPVRTLLVDSRSEALAAAPAGVGTRLTPLPEAVVRAARPGTAFVVMTHDHATDFLIAAEALARGDAAYVGLIGSASKRAAFEGWLKREHGPSPAALTCPVGAAGRGDKRPAVIAAQVAAEVMAALTCRAVQAAPRHAAPHAARA